MDVPRKKVRGALIFGLGSSQIVVLSHKLKKRPSTVIPIGKAEILFMKIFHIVDLRRGLRKKDLHWELKTEIITGNFRHFCNLLGFFRKISWEIWDFLVEKDREKLGSDVVSRNFSRFKKIWSALKTENAFVIRDQRLKRRRFL